ncbi:MAG: hypothetical protein DWQ42_16220 [Planctomycetota bacterium]|nr:MAG: hypothetical protein DWQ42_16220 [Planctomycetota bacterium]REK44769.1 MAG: hypothetical protein DWQ46_08630 [Planctomycetota bacterium]
MSENPYEAPALDVEQVAPHSGQTESAAEEVRRRLISHEASIKSVGVLFWLGGGLGIFAVAAMLFFTPQGAAGIPGGLPGSFELGILAVIVMLGAFQIWVGVALRRLQPWSRIAGAVLAGMSLFSFPIGTIIGGYVIYLLLGAKGGQVFSAEYKRVIALTPHIRHRTSRVLIVLLCILLAVFALVFARMILG